MKYPIVLLVGGVGVLSGCTVAGIHSEYMQEWFWGGVVEVINKGGGSYSGGGGGGAQFSNLDHAVFARQSVPNMSSNAQVGQPDEFSLPSETGPGFHLFAGRWMGATAVRLQGGYTRLGFEGGHDNLFAIGAQVRRHFRPTNQVSPFLGVEAEFARETSVFDFGGDSPSASGYMLGGTAGVRLPTSRVGVNLFVGADFFHIGDFTTNGNLVFPGGNHRMLKFGAELHVP